MNLWDYKKPDYTYTEQYRFHQLYGICKHGPEFLQLFPVGSEYGPEARKNFNNWEVLDFPFEYYPNAIELFRGQTKEQFAQSVEFLEVLIRRYLHENIGLLDTEIFHESLINLALIYGNYRDRCRSSIQDVVSRSKIDDLQNERYLFCALFLKYQEPTLFTERVYTLDVEALEVLMDFLDGKSVRDKLPYPVSREEFHTLFYDFPAELSPCLDYIATFSPTKFLRKVILLVKLSNGCSHSEEVLTRIIFFSDKLRKDPDVFMLDLEFWRRFVEICAANYNSLNVQWYVFLVREFEFDRYEYGYLYPLKVKKFRSLIRKAIDIVLLNRDGFSHVDMKEFRWIKGLEESIFIDVGNESYRVDELSSYTELSQEARYLKHCVAERTLYYANHMKRIFGLRIRTGVGFLPCITIEVSQGTVVQTRGLQNRSPSESEEEAIEIFARKLRFKIASRSDRCRQPLEFLIDL